MTRKKQKNVGSGSHPKTTKKVESEGESSLAKITQRVSSKKQKNESESSPGEKNESESSPEEKNESESSSGEKNESELESSFAPKRIQITSRRRKKFESELENSFAPRRRRSDRVVDLPSFASEFGKRDLRALKVKFLGASAENVVIPDVEVTIPEKYVMSDVSRSLLANLEFNVECIDADEDVKTFAAKIYDVVLHGTHVIGANETFTYTLVDDLLRIAKLNTWPFRIRNHPICKLYIDEEPCVLSNPDFVIKMQNSAILGVEDKHLGVGGYDRRFGESQIAVEILACGSENIRDRGWPTEQSLWAIRVITSYVTFYRTTIPAKYWWELAEGLPQEEVKIQRWPAGDGYQTGFDLATPHGRDSVLRGLAKIREFLRQQSTSSTDVASKDKTKKSIRKDIIN